MPDHELVKIKPRLPSALYDVRYATKDNITGGVLYDDDFELKIQKEVAPQLSYAANLFLNKGYRIVIFDAWRPIEAHRKLLLAHGAADEFVLAEEKSNHPKGLAVDLTIAHKSTNKYLDMGTGFDDMEPLSYVDAIGLSDIQNMNRLLLSGVMAQAGFRQWPYEWWHFDYVGTDERGVLL